MRAEMTMMVGDGVIIVVIAIFSTKDAVVVDATKGIADGMVVVIGIGTGRRSARTYGRWNDRREGSLLRLRLAKRRSRRLI